MNPFPLSLQAFYAQWPKAIRCCCNWTMQKGAHLQVPDKWAKKEILGHLLDSESNNHQRLGGATLQG